MRATVLAFHHIHAAIEQRMQYTAMGKIIANVRAALKWPVQSQKGRLKNQRQVFRRPFNWVSSRLSSHHGIFTAQQGNQCAQALFHFTAVGNLIDCAFFQQEFGTLEAFGQGFAYGLLNHARAGKAD